MLVDPSSYKFCQGNTDEDSMMFKKLLSLASAIFLPVALAIPAPGAPSNPQAPAQGVSPLVAEALTPTTQTAEFAAGRCQFHARVYQQCIGSEPTTSISIPSFIDNTGKSIVKPADGLPVTVGNSEWRIAGLGQDFWAGFKDGAVRYSYGDATWTGEQSSDKNNAFTCTAGQWSVEKFACGSHDHPQSRSQEMNCAFQCDPHKPTTSKHKRSNAAEHTTENSELSQAPTTPSLLEVDPVGQISPAGSDTSAASYAHGYCSFKMQLFNQCIHTPEDGWHSQMLGLLYSIEDNDHKTAVTYPEGAGRIDRGAIRLTGMGDFRLAYNNDDKQVYFAFDGGWWATSTKDDGKAFGLCKWNAWTKPDLVCVPEHGVHYRLSDLACVFKC
ncbi:Nn.00g102420.m01.CDS01 [Neocucurbitaria sp. VM-36]